MSGEGDADGTVDDLTFRWHDNLVYGISFDIGDPARQDWRSELRLDIDFIAVHTREFRADVDIVLVLVEVHGEARARETAL